MSHLQIVEHLVLQLCTFVMKIKIMYSFYIFASKMLSTLRKRTGREAVNCLWKEEVYLFKQFYRLLYKRAMYSVVHIV